MADVTGADIPNQESSRKRGKLISVIVVLLAVVAGFVTVYLGFWSITGMLEKRPKSESTQVIDFVDIPTVSLTIPGATPRALVVSVKIETAPAFRAQVEHLIPRISDAYNAFLSSIDSSAFQKRGVLEIIRSELATRTEYIIGAEAFSDVLITEFWVK